MAQFRAKARAVDLLGKGQIADLPTAISELWKNGYDAYADNLEANLYLEGYNNHPEPIFVLSDDGKGMDNTDIIEKWFVLGTDSKSRHYSDIKGEDTLFKEPRIKMGEKGIGRLAVAYLGPQMLMLTKKKNHPLEIVFFDWRILENYNLYLSDINIPLKTISSVSDFQNIFQELKKDFLLNFATIKNEGPDSWFDQKELKNTIISDCENLVVPEFITEDIIADLLNKPTETHATKFIIFKPDQQIIELKNFTRKNETEDYSDEISINHTVSSLVGLFNQFKTENQEHQTHFWIHKSDNTGKYDLLTFKSFFSPQDFVDCDHMIDGEFDENGSFDGNVRVYDKIIHHTFKQTRKPGLSKYGKFKIKLGYVQDQQEASMISNERKAVFEEKLSYYSGLFIYRDGFRVLPYGRPDADFLEFEERRSRRAGTYFFSKRRIFGYIEISREDNDKLKDKSSREGFINNVAFRDFKTDLIAFFIDLAKKYFATKSENDYKESYQAKIKKLAKAQQQEHERDIQARKDFADQLKSLPSGLDELYDEYGQCISLLEDKIKENEIAYEEIQSLLSKIKKCKTRIAEFALEKPARFELTELQNQKFHTYEKKYNSVTKVFSSSTGILNKAREKLKIQEHFNEFIDGYKLAHNNLSRQFSEFETRLDSIVKKIKKEFDAERVNFVADFEEKYNSIIPSKNNAQDINRSIELLEKIYSDIQERISDKISPYLAHLERLSIEVNEDDLVGYYKLKYDEIKEEWNKTYELAQLGIAVEIIDHQFNTLYSQLAENIKSIKQYVIPGKESNNKYNHLDTAFAHLQDNYKLLQPLYRTTGRTRNNITGAELKDYLDDFFRTRLSENNIAMTITDAAKAWTAYSYESVFKPVLINIINNAIYWLQPQKNKQILLDVQDDKLLIMNSGEPIEDYMLEDIFKLFYSNRPKGRGIGLYLAKQSLNGLGFDIIATNDPIYNKLNGACFCIYNTKR